tara:strand:+ start:4182 stop:4442 length:261 start_codon:yes stop_codon:yes gene_type:complete
MQVTEQTKKESMEILSIFKGRVLNPFKTDKWQNVLTEEISQKLSDYKLRERFNVGEMIKNQYQGFIPTPKATIGNRLRFLFLGEIK